MLKVRGVCLSYGGHRVLKEVNIDVPNDRITGLIGPNGAGKTTLFNVITGFVKPDQGSIMYESTDITGKTPEAICHLGITRTFQLVKTFDNLTVEENVMVGALSQFDTLQKAKTKAREILEFMQMTPIKDLKARSLTLSDKKRLEVARGLATNPKMLLLDEVMSGLNPAEVRQIMAIIRTIHKSGVGVLLIEHIMSAVMDLSDHIIVLANGEKLTEGIAEMVSRDPEVIKAYLGEEYANACN